MVHAQQHPTYQHAHHAGTDQQEAQDAFSVSPIAQEAQDQAAEAVGERECETDRAQLGSAQPGLFFQQRLGGLEVSAQQVETGLRVKKCVRNRGFSRIDL